jgi:hypothetical protein
MLLFVIAGSFGRWRRSARIIKIEKKQLLIIYVKIIANEALENEI